MTKQHNQNTKKLEQLCQQLGPDWLLKTSGNARLLAVELETWTKREGAHRTLSRVLEQMPQLARANDYENLYFFTSPGSVEGAAWLSWEIVGHCSQENCQALSEVFGANIRSLDLSAGDILSKQLGISPDQLSEKGLRSSFEQIQKELSSAEAPGTFSSSWRWQWRPSELASDAQFFIEKRPSTDINV